MNVLRFYRTKVGVGTAKDPYTDLDSSEIPAFEAIVNAAAFQSGGTWNAKSWECGSFLTPEELREVVAPIRNFVGPRRSSEIVVSTETEEMLKEVSATLTEFLNHPGLRDGDDRGGVPRADYEGFLEALCPLDELYESDSEYLYIGADEINTEDLLKLLDFLDKSLEEGMGIYLEETETDEYDDEDEDEEYR